MFGLDITRHKALESYLVTLKAWLAAGKPDPDDLSPLPRS